MSINIDVNNFDALRIGLASPEKIKSWSNGEVKKPETINYRTLKPEKDGLFCERIFGPTKDWECYCGKYKRVRFKGIICERCGVEVTRSSVRRERMGHIDLASPVSHIWFFKGVPSRMGYMLSLTPRDLEKVLYFDSYIIISMDKKKIEDEKDKIDSLYDNHIAEMEEFHSIRIKEIRENNEDFLRRYKEGDHLIELDAFDDSELETEKDIAAKINKIIKENEKLIAEEEEIFNEQKELVKRAKDLFRNLSEKMLIADENLFKKLREIYGDYFKGGMGAEAIKELLKNIEVEKQVEELKVTIDTSKGQKRSKAIKTLKILSAFVKTNNKPEYMILDVLPVIPPDLRPMVQLDGGRFATSDLNDLYRRVINRNNRLKKLLDLDAPEIIINNEKRMLQEAVDALFDNGRRGRAVLGAGNRPLKSLSDMLKGKQGRFRQNLLGKRVDYSGRSVIVVNPNLRLDQCGLPKQIALELFKPFVMKKLVDAGFASNIKSAKIMVERADDRVWDILEAVIKNHPVMLNRAPTLHRLGIQAFMPILVEGKAIQIHPLVCPPFNADFDGDQMAVHVPLSNEAKAEAIVLMLATNNILSPASGEPVSTPSQDMVLGIYYLTSDRIKSIEGKEKFYSNRESVLLDYDYDFISLHTPIKIKVEDKVIKTTPGRIIFNEALPEGYRFINKDVSKKELISIMSDTIRKYPNAVVVKLMDDIKSLGFKYATKSGLTIGIDDIIVPPRKKEILKSAEDKIAKVESYYDLGLITDDERHERVIQTWSQANEDVADAMEKNFDKFNPIYMMATSGARGNIKQLRQLAGMRGLVANARGDIIDRPIKSNFREGLTVLEYFLSSHGARQGLADTALRTADSGYLTRRLVDVSQDILIRINDCETDDGINLYVITRQGESNKNLIGRLCQNDIVSKNGEVLIKKDDEIDEDFLEKLVKANIDTINVRSPLTCEAELGVCQKCYGRNLASGKTIEIGEAVGTIAAQSIGEPGTQLTMRTFHTGGVASTVSYFNAKSPTDGYLIIDDYLIDEIIRLENFGEKKIEIDDKEEKELLDYLSRIENEFKSQNIGSIGSIEKFNDYNSIIDKIYNEIIDKIYKEIIDKMPDDEREKHKNEIEKLKKEKLDKIYKEIIDKMPDNKEEIEKVIDKLKEEICEKKHKEEKEKLTKEKDQILNRLQELVSFREKGLYRIDNKDSRLSGIDIIIDKLKGSNNFLKIFKDIENSVLAANLYDIHKFKNFADNFEKELNLSYKTFMDDSTVKKYIESEKQEELSLIRKSIKEDLEILKNLYASKEFKDVCQKIKISLNKIKRKIFKIFSDDEFKNVPIIHKRYSPLFRSNVEIKEHLKKDSNNLINKANKFIEENPEISNKDVIKKIVLNIDKYNEKKHDSREEDYEDHKLLLEILMLIEGLNINNLEAQTESLKDSTGFLKELKAIDNNKISVNLPTTYENIDWMPAKINFKKGELFIILEKNLKKKRTVHKHEKTFEGMDITSGLPRVVELFEARKPKEHAIAAESTGIVKLEEIDEKMTRISILNAEAVEENIYEIPSRVKIRFNDGDTVLIGDQLTEGPRNPHDILKTIGVKACAQYLVREIQSVYNNQGVEINDKHIEVIVRQMLKKVTILESGDTIFLPGQLVDRLVFEKENRRVEDESLRQATAKQNLMGITKVSLATDSFLSAASFQETTRVLTDAAIENKTDYLIGLKENVIIGKTIPAGTGMTRYRTVELAYPGFAEESSPEIEILPDTGEDEEKLEINI